MNNDPSKPHESLWRRKLADAERAGLRPQLELELEARLTEALGNIPDAPMPSNFTARVLGAIELAEARESRPRGWVLNWRALLPRVAMAAVVLVFAGVAIQRHEVYSHHVKIAKNLAMVATAQLPSPDALENLDAIERMGQAGHADGELLAALQ